VPSAWRGGVAFLPAPSESSREIARFPSVEHKSTPTIWMNIANVPVSFEATDFSNLNAIKIEHNLSRRVHIGLSMSMD
jgi:hypothetical protein